MLLVDLHQAGWFPFRKEGYQQQVPNNVDVNNDGQNASHVELEEMEHLVDDRLEDENEKM